MLADLPLPPSEATCSRAGCVAGAVLLLEWRNPKIHSVDRTKTWATCQDHLEYLTEYLSAREFLLATRELGVAKSQREASL
jgi:hypothetical protein